MVYRLIEKGTMMNLEFKDKLTNQAVSHKGFLHEPARDIVLQLEGDALYDYCNILPHNTPMTLIFHRGQKEFSFEGKLETVTVIGGVKLTELTAMGVIKESHRRLTRRFIMTVDVSLFTQKDSTNPDIRAVCKGQSYDISCDSVSIWSNDEIKNLNDLFYAKFILFGRENFNIPAKILKKKSAPKTSFYKNEYILLFDFSADQREKTRLLDAFIKNSLELRNL